MRRLNYSSCENWRRRVEAGRMCALISRIRESDLRRDAAYKYRRAVMGGQSRLNQDQDQDQDTTSRPSPPLWIYPSGPNVSTLQPWEDTFLSSGWPRAASRPGPAPSPPLDPPPVGRTPRVCRAFTADQRPLRVYQNRRRTGARTWTDSVCSTKPHTATTKVRPEQSEHLCWSVSAAPRILMSQKRWIIEELMKNKRWYKCRNVH